MTEQEWILALKNRRGQIRIQMLRDFRLADKIDEKDHRFMEIRMIGRILSQYKYQDEYEEL